MTSDPAPRRVVLMWRALPDPCFIEWVSASVLIGYGLFLFFVPDAFQMQIYFVLNGLMPWWMWVLSACSIGQFQIAMIHSHRQVGRMVAALLSGVMWSILTVGLYQGNSKLPGITAYAGYVAMNLLTMALLFRRIP